MKLHSTPRPERPEASLPEGVTRCNECDPSTTLESCEAVLLTVRRPGREDTTGVVIWRERCRRQAIRVRPLTKRRISELRPGDWVRVRGEKCVVLGLQIWR